MIEHVKRSNPNTQGLLNSVRMQQIKGSTLFLGFSSEVLKEKMDHE